MFRIEAVRCLSFDLPLHHTSSQWIYYAYDFSFSEHNGWFISIFKPFDMPNVKSNNLNK